MRLSVIALSLICCVPTAVSAQSARQEKTINLPAGVSVEGAAISRAGNLVAAICSDHVVRVWSARSGELMRTIKEDTGRPSGVQFSGDGRLLAVSYETVPYEEGTIKVIDVDSWKVQSDLTSECMFCTLSFSPDGQRLASAGNSDTYVWDVATQKKVATISPPFRSSTRRTARFLVQFQSSPDWSRRSTSRQMANSPPSFTEPGNSSRLLITLRYGISIRERSLSIFKSQESL